MSENMIRRWALVGLLSMGSGPAAFAATYYIAPSGSDSGAGSSASPFRTLSHAMSAGSGGDTFILKDGTYNYAGSEFNDVIKSGFSFSYTIIKAENDGGAVVTITDGLAMRNDSLPLQRYIQIEGIKFEGAYEKTIYGDHVKFLRCAFKGGPPSGNTANTVVGGNANGSNLARYILFEDCWFYGLGGRYKLVLFNAENIVVRRVVIRNDGGWNDAPSTSNPEAGFAIYNSSACEMQNLVIVDSDQDYYYYTSAFYLIHNPSATPDHPVQGNRVRGLIIVNTKEVGFQMEGVDTTDNSLTDSVVVNSQGWAYAWGSYDNTTFSVNRAAAIRKNSPFSGQQGGGFGYWGSGGNITVTNSIVSDYTTGDDFNGISPTYFNTYNNGSTTSGTGRLTSNPLSNGWLYPPRIEDGSTLKTAGSGGGQIGPRITTKIGTSGTLWGESGYNTDTGDALWPWPNEARIVKDLCSGVTRGFCGRESLTQYVWEALGQSSPFPNTSFSNSNSDPDPAVPDNLRAREKFVTPLSSTGARVTFGDEAVEVTIVDVRGGAVFHAVKSGSANVTWDGRTDNGQVVDSGSYLCKIRGVNGNVFFQLISVVK